jgi:hypothetical protein
MCAGHAEYMMIHRLKNAAEQRDVLLNLISMNYEHMRHQENERVTYFSIYCAAIGIVIAEMIFSGPSLITTIVFALLPFLGKMSLRVMKRWSQVFTRYRNLVIRHTMLLHLLLAKSGASVDYLTEEDVNTVFDSFDEDVSANDFCRAADEPDAEKMARMIYATNHYSHLENNPEYKRYVGISNEKSGYKSTASIFDRIMSASVWLGAGIAVYELGAYIVFILKAECVEVPQWVALLFSA